MSVCLFFFLCLCHWHFLSFIHVFNTPALSFKKHPCTFFEPVTIPPSLIAFSLLERLLDLHCQSLRGFLRVPQKHVRVLLIEHRVVQVRVPASHRALHVHTRFGVPNFQHRHAVDRTSRQFLGSRVGDVVGSDHEGDVGLSELLIDLVHLEHPIVGHSGLCEEDVHLSRHSACHWVDPKPNVDVGIAQGLGEICECVLRLCHCHSVPGHNHDALGHLEGVCHLLDGRLSVFSLLNLGAVSRCRGCVSSQQDVSERPVHCLAHDMGEDRTTASDERAHCCQKGVIQHEPLCNQGPTRVGVQNRDAHRHVCTAH
mmetsp:Transcript_16953/g.34386  ORF Transcript_16953/g.34386 Transcript_16953/m.34386 type:complete len:312 (+) Transcript_16953:674-1609(+)